jgi:diadenosine tetraphosphatase ApaH/serine/threonine PP2A family protein phosphatase
VAAKQDHAFMKLALLSDIHANSRALEACLAHASALGAQRLALLGDLVGYGAEPAQVVQRVMALAQQGAVVLRGNHDALAVSPPPTVARLGEAGAQWTHDQLSPAQRQFLADLPLTHREDTLLLVHASVDEPALWRYVNSERAAAASLDAAVTPPHGSPEVRHVFVGHVHQQTLYYRGTGRDLMGFVPTPGVPIPTPRHRSWIATVGSVGQPRDGRTEAMYAVFDTAAMQLTFYRVPYDHNAEAASIRAAGLPDFFAQRLEMGR